MDKIAQHGASPRATEAPGDDNPLVSVRGVSKTFAGTRALDLVDLDVRPGEIHALCGGNGSGKSTLIKILSGVYKADPGGQIIVALAEIAADHMTPADSHRLGIRTVHQDLGVFPDLNVAENLAIGSGFETSRFGRVIWRRQRSKAAQLLKRFHIPTSPRAKVKDLSLVVRTELAIARALQDAGENDELAEGLLILDEPTAALPVKEVEQLLKGLRRLADAGHSILYVSHRLDEVLDLCDRVTILRDGRTVGTHDVGTLDEQRLVELMLGRTLEKVMKHKPDAVAEAPVLELTEVSAGLLRDVSLVLRAGEILGVAGLVGSGRSTLLRTVFAQTQRESGEIRLNGRATRFVRPSDAIRAGVIMVPEDRVQDSAFMDLSIDLNGALSVIGRYWRGGLLRSKRLRLDGQQIIEDFGIKAASGREPMSSLSGGNQQKLVLARWMRRVPSVLLLDEPTQGVDAGARSDIYSLVRQSTEAGACAIVVASDFEELAQVADRVIVLRRGRITAEISGADVTAQRITELSIADERVKTS
jgi:ribose transport system ATP-binding protein